MSASYDPISDMLTKIRNAVIAKHKTVDIPSSKMKISIIQILKDEGFIKSFKVNEDSKQNIIKIYLKYNQFNESTISVIKKVSLPSRKAYVKAEDLKPVFNNAGIWILSTSKGIITNKAAKNMNVGGELVCEIL